jgi:DNA polymerase III subunit delta
MTAPVYLYTGPEFGDRNAAVEKIRLAVKKTFEFVDEYLFYATETPVAEVITLLQSGSLFSNAVFIVFRGAESIKRKDDVDMIASWVKTVTKDSAILVLVSDEISVDQKIDKVVPASNKKVFWEMFEDRKIPWLQGFFSQNGYTVGEDAAENILDMVENNTEELRSECSRFFLCYPKGREITSDDVDAILSHNRDESAFTLFNEMTLHNELPSKLENSLAILQKIRLSKDCSSVMILSGLTVCFRRLAVWQKLHATGKTDDFSFKINGFSSKKARTQYNEASHMWSLGQTAAILALISLTDMEIRSGGTLLEDLLLQKLIYEIVIKKGSLNAEYESADIF